MEDAKEVLKLSYSFPATAVKFFCWFDKHSPYGWNLVVNLLGKNRLFNAMWDAIRSMKKEWLLSLATFAFIFSSYVAANRVDEEIMTFEVKDIIALNSLLRAICRDRETVKAKEFLDIARDKIRPYVDTNVIMLEGWENEGNIAFARQTFRGMVWDISWDPRNVPAYNSFLNTLLKGHDYLPEVMNLFAATSKRRLRLARLNFSAVVFPMQFLFLQENREGLRNVSIFYSAFSLSNYLSFHLKSRDFPSSWRWISSDLYLLFELDLQIKG